MALLKEAVRQNKPVLAICRGVQLVNVAFGGTLHQEVEGHWQGLPFGTSHSIETKKGSVVERLFGQASQINSVHRQSIKDLAPNFRVTAIDPRDQTIEAIEAVDGHRIIGFAVASRVPSQRRKRQSRTLPLSVTRIVKSLGFFKEKEVN